jgi:NAD-dependent dihydropyrimidine dehydrogenase PreA subunit
MTYIVDPALCTGCGSCVDACPSEAVVLDEDCARIDDALCAGCGACIEECPAGAIEETD